MEKDADAYRTISEVADALDLPAHVLRFWETKFPQIKPLKRGGGRRYYRRDDFELLRSIRKLLHEDGYTIRGVQRMLKEQGPRALTTAAGETSAGSAIPVSDPMSRLDSFHVGELQIDTGLRPLLTAVLAEIEACRALLGDGSMPTPPH